MSHGSLEEKFHNEVKAFQEFGKSSIKEKTLVILACQTYCLHLMEEQSQSLVSGSELPDALRNTAASHSSTSMAENHAIFPKQSIRKVTI